MNWEYSFDFAAMFIFAFVLTYFSLYAKRKTPRSGYFTALIIAFLVTTGLDLHFAYFSVNHSSEPMFLLYLSACLYFFGVTVCAFFYLAYSASIISTFRETSRAIKIAVVLPLIIQAVLLILTPFNNFLFYYTQSGGFVKGPLMQLIYLVPLYYVVFAAVYLLKYRAAVQRKKLFMIIAALFVMAIPSASQYYYPKLRILMFCLALYSVVMLMKLQNVNLLIDPDTRAQNMESLAEKLQLKLATKKKFAIIAVEIENYWMFNKSLGINQTNLLLREFVTFFGQLLGVQSVYRIKENVFGLYMEVLERNELDKIIVDITDRFEQPWDESLAISVDVRLCVMDYPSSVSTINELNGTLLYFQQYMASEKIVFASNFNNAVRTRQSVIEDAVSSGYLGGGFTVYYRPLISAESGKVEALSSTLKLCKNEYGIIDANEIIGIAEQSGRIISIELDAFEEICRFISLNRLWEIGIKDIEVHLSPIECMQYRIDETLLSIIKKHAVPPEILNFSVPEVSGDVSPLGMLENLRLLVKSGAKVSVDNYGDGYTDISCLFDFPLDMIRLSARMLKDAAENENAMIALQCTANMIRELGMKVTIQGIYDRATYETARQINCDYYQGEFLHSYHSAAETIKLFKSL